MKWIDVKHRPLTLFLTLFCVLAGAFGMGEEPDERLFRSRTNHRARSSQSHHVLDGIHEDLLGGADQAASRGNDQGKHNLVAVLTSNRVLAPTFGVLRCLTAGESFGGRPETRTGVRDRAPPVLL